VIVVSENLLQSKQAFNRHTYLVPNGVDYQAYVQALESDELLPADIARLPRPLLGYSGLIADRLDLDLLRYVAAAHPEWSLALVGTVDDRRCGAELSALGRMANVHFLGRKEIGQVPHYVKAFDVCLIPYTVNERAENASPLKLYDYLAAGKPIVTTDFPAARQFSDVVHIADSREEFARYVAEALSERDSSLPLKRRRVAASHTWEDRVSQVSDLIRACLAQADQGFEIQGSRTDTQGQEGTT
jgi:glycosyltransferase involved in cell wall biosynthesis